MLKEIIFAVLVASPIVMASDAASKDFFTNVNFDGGGNFVNSTNYYLFTSITGLSGTTKAGNTFVCLGYLCFSMEELNLRPMVSFLLDINISGQGTEKAQVDMNKTTGFYLPYELNKYFVCVEDAGIARNPTFGIVFSGQQLRYIDLENTTNSYIMRVGQLEEDNKFLLPVTSGGCSNIGDKLPLLSLVPFVPAAQAVDSIDLFLSYPYLDLIGNIEKSGKVSLVLEKNNTNQIVVDVI